LVDFARLRYAVIEAVRADADPERFVIAYRTEQALHDLAPHSAFTVLGFFSREEAEASIKRCVSAAAA